jgi:glycine cleavage system aminomethyltransferase T
MEAEKLALWLGLGTSGRSEQAWPIGAKTARMARLEQDWPHWKR